METRRESTDTLSRPHIFSQGFRSKADHYFLAANYHMTELQAAVGLAQIEKYDQSITARRQRAAELDELLADEDVITSVGTMPDCKQTYFYYCFTLELDKLKVDCSRFVKALSAEGQDCEHGYPGPIPLYRYTMIKDKKTFGNSGWPFDSPAARKKWDYSSSLCPKAEDVCSRTVILPWNEGLRPEHVKLTAEAILKVVNAYKA